ncbi:hypothetical protein PG995_006057 [Apiospora arundinis]
MAEPDYVAQLHVVSWTLGAVIIVLCLARVWGRAVVIKQTGWDDFCMVCATVFAIACSALVTVGVGFGLGRHTDAIADPHDKMMAIKYTVMAPPFSVISSAFGKISILIFLLRLMGVVADRWHMRVVWGLCILLVLLDILAIVATIGFCVPAERIWDSTVDGHCMPLRAQVIIGSVQTSYNALMDLILAIFPTLFITKLNINRKMKIGLCLLMGGGIFAAAATIVKVYMMQSIDQHDDLTWSWAPITLWYTAEMDAIIIAGTIPALWPILKMFAKKTGSSGESYGPYKNASASLARPGGSESYQLPESRGKGSGSGPMTRALQEVDELES